MFNIRRRRSRTQPISAQIVELLEHRKLLTTVNFLIDAQQDVRPISKFIYGVNQSLAAGHLQTSNSPGEGLIEAN